MTALSLMLALALAAPSRPKECANPPSRASEAAYWSFIDACGCADLEAPSAASKDHDRYLKACSAWRARNRKVEVVVTSSPAPAFTPAPSECAAAPSSASAAYWTFLASCGCSAVEPPNRASATYDRFLKECGDWREKNPQVEVVPASPAPSAPPSPAPR